MRCQARLEDSMRHTQNLTLRGGTVFELCLRGGTNQYSGSIRSRARFLHQNSTSVTETEMPLKFNSLKINYKAVFNGENHRILVGQVAKINKEEGSCRVKCLRLSLDPKLLKYWSYR